MQHGKIEVQTGHTLISQWESKYFSQALHFVIPFMVSGPDYSFHDKTNRWRRRDDPRWGDAPLVSASKFTAAFARRCESQCRQDWNALPIIRSVNFRYAVETGNTMVSVPLWWKRGSAVQLSAQEHAKMVTKPLRGVVERPHSLRQHQSAYQRRHHAAPFGGGLKQSREVAGEAYWIHGGSL